VASLLLKKMEKDPYVVRKEGLSLNCKRDATHLVLQHTPRCFKG
jgi:hypothetical protein